MAKTFALRLNGKILELFPPRYYDEDVYSLPVRAQEPSEEHPYGVEEQPPVLLHKVGEEIPIGDRYHPDFVATLIEVDPDNLPADDPEPPPPAVTAEQAQAQRDAYLAEATLRIAPLQDAVDLDEATGSEAALLKLWKQYRVSLSRIETQAGFPANVQWPVVPA